MSHDCERMNAAKIERKYRRRTERRCFWTHPFGHCTHWEFLSGTLDKIGKCCHCGKTSTNFCPIRPTKRTNQ